MSEEKPIKKVTKQTRASVIFFREDKNGDTNEYLGLLDMGSNGGLLSKDLVKEYGFKCKKSSSVWDINTSIFKIGETTHINGLQFP